MQASPTLLTFLQTTSEQQLKIQESQAPQIYNPPKLSELIQRTLGKMSFETLQKLRQVPAQIIFKTLDNGLTLCFQHRKKANSDAHMASIRLAVKAGHLSENNAAKEQGFAHFVEHAVFLGTEKHSQEQINQILESLGCQLGSDANAITGPETTVYKLDKVPTDNEQLLHDSIELMYEFACKATFPRDLVEKESHVIESELLRNQGWKIRCMKWQMENVFNNQEYLDHLPYTLCKERDMVEQLKEFYKNWYCPHNMCVIAVGDFGSAENQANTLSFLSNTFNKIPTAEQRKIPKKVLNSPPVSVPVKSVHLAFAEKELTTTAIYIMKRLPDSEANAACSCGSMDPDLASKLDFSGYAREMTRQLMNSIISTAFHRIMLDPSGPIASVQAQIRPGFPTKTTSFLNIIVSVKSNRVADAYRIALEHLKKLVVFGPQDTALDAVKTSFKQRKQNALKSLSQATHDFYANHYLEAYKADAPIDDLGMQMIGFIYMCDAVAKSHIQAQLSEWDIFSHHDPQKFTTYVVGPQINETQLIPLLEEAYIGIKTKEIHREIEAPLNLEWLPGDLPPAPLTEYRRLDSYSNDRSYGIEMECLLFANGLKAVMAPTHDKNETISLRLIIPHGAANCQARQEMVASSVGIETLNFLGIKSTPLQDILAVLGPLGLGQVYGHMHYYDTEFALDIKHEEQLENALRLIYAKIMSVREIRLDEFKTGFSLYLGPYKEFLRNKYKTSQGYFTNETTIRTSGNHPALLPDDPSELDKLTPEECLNALINSAGDVSGATLLVCGRFNKEKTTVLLQKYAGRIENIAPRKSTPIRPFEFAHNVPGPHQFYIGDAPNRSTTMLVYPLKAWGLYEENHKRWIASLILNKFLIDKIRFKNQDTYTLAASLTRNPLRVGDHRLSLQFTSPTDEHAALKEKILEAVRELSQAAPEKIEEYLKFQVMSIGKTRDQNKNLTSNWTQELLMLIKTGLDLSSVSKKPDWEMQMKPEEVRSILSEACDLSRKPVVEITMHPRSVIGDQGPRENV